MSKLINTYAYLRENYDKLDFTHDLPPKYINLLSGREDEKIIFAHVNFFFVFFNNFINLIEILYF